MAHLLGGRGDAERLLRLVEITDAPARSALLGAGRRGGAGAPRHRARACSPTCAGRGLLEQALYLDTHMFLPDGILLCNDKMSMAAGLELRVPFLDLELMRFVERIPARHRVRPRQPQAPPPARDGAAAAAARCRTAASTASPPPTTTGCARRSAREVERRYAPGSPLAELIDPAAAARLVDEHRRGRADHKSILYCLLELSEWHAAFVEAREPVAA